MPETRSRATLWFGRVGQQVFAQKDSVSASRVPETEFTCSTVRTQDPFPVRRLFSPSSHAIPAAVVWASPNGRCSDACFAYSGWLPARERAPGTFSSSPEVYVQREHEGIRCSRAYVCMISDLVSIWFVSGQRKSPVPAGNASRFQSAPGLARVRLAGEAPNLRYDSVSEFWRKE